MISEQQTHAVAEQLMRIRATVSDVHHRIDDVTADVASLKSARRAEIVRRAEEAGAALARLEWALDRATHE